MFVGSADGLPMVASNNCNDSTNINYLRNVFHEMEADAAALTVERMDAEVSWDTTYRNKELLAEPKSVSEYRKNMQDTMRKASNSNYGFIVWLNVNDMLPPLESIKAHIIFPKDIQGISQKMKAAARRFVEERIATDDSLEKSCFDALRITRMERNYLDDLSTNPMKFANEVADNWHPLPLLQICQELTNPEVSLCMIIMC